MSETPVVLPQSKPLAFLILAAFLVSGCAPPPGKEPSWVTCTNREAGFTVAYPPDWKTNPGSVLPSCSLFHPSDIALSPGTEVPFDIAVTVLEEDVPFDTAIRGYGLVKVLGSDALRIDGHRAIRMEFIDEDPQLGPGSQTGYHYLIDLGEKTLEASSYALGEPAYSRKKAVLDRMMREIRIAD